MCKHSCMAFLYPFCGNSFRNAHLVNGAAANIFQKNAIGKFLISVPTQMAGRLTMLAWARMTLNKIDAARLIAGHMIMTVQAWRIS